MVPAVPRVYASSKDRLLDVAERIIVRGGLDALSVEAVVREAGLTKGAFFHHFKTKNAMLAALTERLGQQVADQARRSAANDPEPRGRSLRAQLDLVFGADRVQRERLRALVLALLQSASSNPQLRARARAANAADLRRSVAEGLSVGRALVLQLALDGYFIAESFGSIALSAAQRKALHRELLTLTRGEP
jgi:AcrR family transcriptional regulator